MYKSLIIEADIIVKGYTCNIYLFLIYNLNMKIVKSIFLSLLPALGGILMVLGEIDDSPGLGGIGLILICLSVYLNTRSIK